MLIMAILFVSVVFTSLRHIYPMKYSWLQIYIMQLLILLKNYKTKSLQINSHI